MRTSAAAKLVEQANELDTALGALADAARKDPAVFCQFVLRDEATGLPITLAPVHIEWHDILNERDRVVIWSATELGKALPLDTPIPTPGGWSTMGALRVGDQVFARDGKPCRVTFATEIQHNRSVYRIAFDDGDSVLADADHRWIARPANGAREFGVYTTRQMLDAGLTIGDRKMWALPVAGAAEYPDRDLSVPPYVLGAWLGDGDKNVPRITFHEDDRHVFDRCVALVGGAGTWQRDKRRPAVVTAAIGCGALGRRPGRDGDASGLKAKLRALGVLGDKHIPAIYLTASIEQRRELLAGLLDTDGSVTRGRGGTSFVEFCSCSERLAADVIELVRSLGLKARIKASPAKLRGRTVGTRWRVTFTARVPVFSLPRKLAAQNLTPNESRANYRYITAIEPVESVPVRCISVDSADRSYLMGRSYTVTHNTAQISIGRVLWEIGRDPNIRILIVGAASGIAKKIVKAIKTYIENSPEFRMVFPHIVPDKSDTTGRWRDDSFNVRRSTKSKDPTVQAVGYGGNVLGARLDLIIADDYLTPENTYSDHQREKSHGWLKSVVEGRKTARARWWFIGNAWHLDDAMHRYAAEELTYSKKFPVRDEVTGESVWPEVWPTERIEKEIKNRGPIESRRSMFCDPVSDADRRFKSEYIVRALQAGDGLELAFALSMVPNGYRTITGVDLAVSKKDSADWTALTTIAVEERAETRQVLDITAGKMDGPQIVDAIIDIHRRYHSIVYVESNACFPPGSRVLTRERGYVPIEDVQVGEHTWTHAARWRPVLQVISGNGRRISHTRASGSLQVSPTSNHWFYMREAGRTPGRGGGHHRPVGDPCWISAGFAERAAYTAIAVPKWPPCKPTLSLPGTRRSKAKTVRVDEEIAMLLGLYVAEGSGSGLRGEAQTVLTLGSKEMYIARWAASVMRKIVPGRVSIKGNESVIKVVANSTALARALKAIGKSDLKTLPIEWLGWPLKLRLAVVRGWLLGDGAHVANNVRTSSASRNFVGMSISRNWAMWVRATLLNAGYRPALDVTTRRSAVIEGREVKRRPIYGIRLAADDSSDLLKTMTTAIEQQRWPRRAADKRVRLGASRSHHEGGHLWSFLLKGPGSFSEHDGAVYNLIVEDDESFTVEDYIVHNAQAYIKQFVNKESAVPVKAFFTGRNKVDPTFGIESLAVEMSQGKWIFPNQGGTLTGRMDPEMRKLISELVRYDPASHTGDRLMSLWLAREGARKSFGAAGVGKRARRT